MKNLGLYIHIPFCIKKCFYCDFLSFENTGFEVHRRYIDAVKKEIEYYGGIYGNKYLVNSIFIGGGTPSLIDAHLIEELMESLKKYFPIAESAEITIETNPKTLTRQKLEIYRRAGVNRLSIGVQSLYDMELKRLGRVHKAEDFIENYKTAREVGFQNINMDLMFAIPQHTQEVWEATLKQAIDLNPEHISFYSLQLEEGTPYFEQFERGEILQIPDEVDRRMYHRAVELLTKAGYEHYEISNCAKKGFECKHNLKYWNMEEYLGLGLGSHSFVEEIRFSNTKDLKLYNQALAAFHSDPAPWVTERYKNTPKDSQSEYVFTGMRKLRGIDLIDFKVRFGKEFFEAYPEQKEMVEKYMEQNYVRIENNHMSFTLKGIDISNRILAEFV
ncbi:radical SAM family heme chaperone HemW [Clostridium aminobutyricum]|uniref:Heme chaperone HemW n=1 Tax=Clostridium aminobutyricum TaxID=33953 RepID=A0A939D666_CLOAM|nr:radical SAM family heme chaperone HemW [Clostridium aminobutyricum]MBN7772254.1 oxygen-independent coproporphyrinogen III oxidase [Clostridium aminobutyricum]